MGVVFLVPLIINKISSPIEKKKKRLREHKFPVQTPLYILLRLKTLLSSFTSGDAQ